MSGGGTGNDPGNLSAGHLQSEAVQRAERALDEAYSRYAGLEESVRLAGLEEALEQALASEPAPLRLVLLDQLEERHALPAENARVEVLQPPPTNTAELNALRSEVERLRVALAAAATAAPADADRALLRALIGGEADRLTNTVDAARAARVVQALATFARDMVKGFLSDPSKAGDSVVQLDRLRSSLGGELSGSLASGSVEALLNEVTRRVGVQLEAFSVACERGAKSLLNELGPQVIEDTSGDPGIFGKSFKTLWEAFARRQRELVDTDDLFESYFDPALRNAIYQLREKK